MVVVGCVALEVCIYQGDKRGRIPNVDILNIQLTSVNRVRLEAGKFRRKFRQKRFSGHLCSSLRAFGPSGYSESTICCAVDETNMYS